MSRGKGIVRRGAAIIVVAVGLLAVAGPGAGAAGGLPEILNGSADAQALRIQLKVPATAELKAALKEALAGSALEPVNGVVAGIPDLSQGILVDQTISLTHGNAIRANDKATTDFAAGFAAPLQGSLLNQSVKSRCESASCNAGDSVGNQKIELPLGIGYIKLAGAESLTSSNVDTRNTTALAEVHLTLQPLISEGAPLAAVGDALKTLTDTVNDAVLPPVNEAIENVEATLRGLLPDGIEQGVIDRVIPKDSIGPVKDLPDLRDVDLLNLMVLGAQADVRPKTVNGKAGLLSRASSKIADINILENPLNGKTWANIDAINLTTQAFANGVRADALANTKSDAKIVGADLGGLLGIDIDRMDLEDLTDIDYLAKVIKQDVPEGLVPAIDELVAAVRLVYNVAGIDVKTFEPSDFVNRTGTEARAAAQTVQIVVEPKIPKISALQQNLPRADAIVPRLKESDFVSTGIRLTIDAPNTSAVSAMGTVKSFSPPPRTGVATPLLAGVLFIGAAVMVRRFALTK